MRRRLTFLLVVATSFVVMTGVVSAQAPGAGGGGRSGTDQEATGELLPGGTGAAVGVGFESTTGGVAGGDGGSGGESGSGSGITCRLTGSFGGFPTNLSLSVADLQTAYDTGGRQPVLVYRTCFDGAGSIVSAEEATWSPPAGGGAPVLVDPEVLAGIARSRLSFPSPVVSMSPPADQGTYAQLPTFFVVENWAEVSEQASAGPVTATVTASPVRQRWEIHDTFRGATETVSCEGPGAAFDPGRPLEAQLPPMCGWTPNHSSAGQGQQGGPRGEACFPTTVTLAWSVGWGSNIGAGGALGEGTSSTDLCLVVAELQAVVVDGA
jgi:hypothetical protein